MSTATCRRKAKRRRTLGLPSRAGRPRDVEAKRFPSGQIKRTRKENEMAALQTVITQRRKRLAAERLFSDDALKDPRFGSALGRLWIQHEKACAKSGRIRLDIGVTQGMFDAGQKYEQVQRKFRRAIEAPSPTPKIANLDKGARAKDPEEHRTPTHQLFALFEAESERKRAEFALNAITTWRAMVKKLEQDAELDGADPRLLRATVELATIHDADLPEHRLILLRKGLRILQDFFHIRY